MTSSTKFLRQAYERVNAEYPAGAERDYLHAVLEIIQQAEVPSSMSAAVGLFLFLQSDDFEYGGFSTMTHPGAGSLEDDSFLVAAVFGRPHDRNALESELSAVPPAERDGLAQQWATSFAQVPGVTVYSASSPKPSERG